MTVLNEPSVYNINDEVAGSEILISEKPITKENDVSLFAKYNEIEDEASSCFVLGYN